MEGSLIAIGSFLAFGYIIRDVPKKEISLEEQNFLESSHFWTGLIQLLHIHVVSSENVGRTAFSFFPHQWFVYGWKHWYILL